MKTLIDSVQAFAATLGAPGLFVVAFLDSSFLSLPQINDLLLVLSVTRAPHLMPLYATMATLGSIAGCFVMYGIGRKGGDALLRSRFQGPHLERAMRLFNRFGLLAVLVPAILPPPAPFKVFVILAGAAKLSPWRFALAVGLGRGFRYFGEGFLAVWYGEAAMDFLRGHGREVALWVGLAVLAGGIAYVVWHNRRSAGGRAATDGAAGPGL